MEGQIARYIAAMSEVQRPVVEQFLLDRQRQGLKVNTLHGDIVVLYQFSRSYAGPWDQVTRDHVFAWLDAQQYMRTTEQLYRAKLRVFFNWLGHPLKIPSLKGAKKPPLDPKALLTPEEIQALISALDHPQDRALVATLWDSAAADRLREMLKLLSIRPEPIVKRPEPVLTREDVRRSVRRERHQVPEDVDE